MKKLCALIPEDENNIENFIETTKGNIRIKLSTAFAVKIPVFNTPYLRTFIEIFFNRFTSVKFFDREEEIPDNYVFILTLSELEEIFRQEIEYHVIKRKLPVWVASASLDKEQLVKIIIPDESFIKEKKEAPLLKFPTLREAEKFLTELFGDIERVSVAKSFFSHEDNLLIIYKIKDTIVK